MESSGWSLITDGCGAGFNGRKWTNGRENAVLTKQFFKGLHLQVLDNHPVALSVLRTSKWRPSGVIQQSWPVGDHHLHHGHGNFLDVYQWWSVATSTRQVLVYSLFIFPLCLFLYHWKYNTPWLSLLISCSYLYGHCWLFLSYWWLYPSYWWLCPSH